jgi:hypothetical protein
MSYSSIISLMKKGHEAYKRRLEFDASTSALYDLGSSLYLQAVQHLHSRGQGSGVLPTNSLYDSLVKDLLADATVLFGAGIKKDPLNSDCWSGLGLCAPDEEVPMTDYFIYNLNFIICLKISYI